MFQIQIKKTLVASPVQKQVTPDPKLKTSGSLHSEVVHAQEKARKKAFVVMPFAPEYEPVFSAIKRACENTGIEAIRADELLSPGPIINQVFDTISKADCIIAEIGSRNPNVYYEVALAHCVEKPSILLAEAGTVDALPFDLRHNRVITYRRYDTESLVADLERSLGYLKQTVLEQNVQPNLEEHLENLSGDAHAAYNVLGALIGQVGEEFELTNARLEEWVALKEGGILLKLKDGFGERVAFTLDVNGNVRRKQRL